LGNKKGPEEALRTPPEFGVASATPGGAPGYDENHKFDNNVSHIGANLPKDCVIYTGLTLNVKARRHDPHRLRLTKFLEFGEQEFTLCCHAQERARDAGIRLIDNYLHVVQ
jgi:hypothetical protein